MRIESIEGIGDVLGERLRSAGIFTVSDLLEKGASRSGRAALARMVGTDESMILTWVGAADLMRIDGVGPEYAELLRLAGVASPIELARRDPDHLAEAVARTAGAAPGTVRRLPSAQEIGAWITAAADLPAVVDH